MDHGLTECYRIDQLGNDNPRVREEATLMLRERVTEIREQLIARLDREQDPEVRARLELVLWGPPHSVASEHRFAGPRFWEGGTVYVVITSEEPKVNAEGTSRPE